MKTRTVTPLILSAILAAAPSVMARPKNPSAVPAIVTIKQAATPTPTPTTATQIEVLVIEGTNGTGGIGAGLQELPQLTRPPFSAYTQMTLVSRTTVPLATTASSVPLPNGSAAITSQGRLPNGRYQVTVLLTLAGRAHNLQFSTSPGDPFFTARATGPNGALILGFIVR